MPALQTFTFPVTSQEVRVFGDFSNPWFCLSDICSILELSNPSHLASSQLKKDGITLSDTVDSLGKPQKVLSVNEANLYRCVMRSRKPSAIEFQDWIVETLLPEIRKTGSFNGVPNSESKAAKTYESVEKAIAVFKGAKSVDSDVDQFTDVVLRLENSTNTPTIVSHTHRKGGRPCKNATIALEPCKKPEYSLEELYETLQRAYVSLGCEWLNPKLARGRTRKVLNSIHAQSVFQELADRGMGQAMKNRRGVTVWRP